MTTPGLFSDEISLIEWILGAVVTAFSGVTIYMLNRISGVETEVHAVADVQTKHALYGDDELWKVVNQLQRDFHEYRVHVADRMLAKDDFYKAMAENSRVRVKQQEELLEAIRHLVPRM